MGTREQNGQPESMSLGSGQIWRAYFLGSCHPWGVTHGVKTTDAFPQMQAYTGSMPADVRWGLGRATRITVYREKLEDIILPPSALYGGSPKGLSAVCPGHVYVVKGGPNAAVGTVGCDHWSAVDALNEQARHKQGKHKPPTW